MIGLLQRVREARVSVEQETVAAIGRGLLVLVGIEKGDDKARALRLLERLLAYRVFADSQGRMNLSVRDSGGSLLLVPQFTLAADTRKGTRASFTPAALPQDGERLFNYLAAQAQLQYPRVAAGRFGADMQVSLINDGPVTFWLRVPPAAEIRAGNSGQGRLYYLIGASGAGKDSLMNYAREKLAPPGGVIFAHRYITRGSDPSFRGERHLALSEEEFEQRLRDGCFALHWRSHGCRYGVGIEVDQWLALGLRVVVNGSRAYLEQAVGLYPGLCPVLIRVSPLRLRERLLARGRETAAEIEERLRRADELDRQTQNVPGLIVIDNEGELQDAGERLVALLTSDRPGDA